MNSNNSSNNGGHFTENWLGGSTAHKSIRRRIMAILRASCMVLGIRRNRGGLGALGHSSASSAVAAHIPGGAADSAIFQGGMKWAVCSLALATALAASPAQAQIAIGTDTTPADDGSASATGVSSIAIGFSTVASATNAVAIGAQTQATADNSVATGITAQATGRESNASGYGSVTRGIASNASGAYAEANGNHSNASGYDSLANGIGANASGFSSEALADYSNASGYQATASGEGSNASGVNALASGAYSNASGANSVASGAGSNASGYSAEATGNYSNASGYDAIASGEGSNASGTNAVASGAGSNASGYSAEALGSWSNASGYDSIAQGAGANASGFRSQATGNYSNASGYAALASGESSNASGVGAIASGVQSNASGAYSVASGDNSSASGVGSTAGGVNAAAVGVNAQANGLDSVAIGTGSSASVSNAFALGTGAVASHANSVALGSNSVSSAAVATPNAVVNGTLHSFAGGNPTSVVSVGAVGAERQITNVAAGRISAVSTDAVNGSQLFAVAQEVSSAAAAGPMRYRNVNGTSTGAGSNDENNSGAIGANAIAIGDSANAFGANSIATGTNAIAVAASGVALGNGAIATHSDSVALGSGSQTSVAVATPSAVINGVTYNFAGATPTSVISVGTSTNQRQITNVAAGQISASSTDAVNGSQLNAVTTALAGVTATAGAGWNISAEGANASNVASGETVDLNNSDGNIDVIKTAGSDNVTFDLADNINVNSVTMGATVLNASGLTIAGGPSITTTGINAGNTVITNVAPGVAGTDAANMNQVNAVGAVANRGWDLRTTATGTGQSVTPTTEVINSGEQVNLQAGNNLIVTQTGNTVSYALNPTLTGLAQVSVAGGPSMTSSGINMGGTSLTNLAAGAVTATSTDAINGSQLFAATMGATGVATRYRHVNGTSTGAGSNDENNSGAVGVNAIAIGDRAAAFGASSTAIGSGAAAFGADAIATGTGADASGARAIASGFNSEASSSDAVAVGSNATANVRNTVAVGNAATASAADATAIGRSALADGSRAIAVGTLASATAANATAIGNAASAIHADSVALGSNSVTSTAVAAPSAVINGTTYAFAGAAPTSVVSVGAVGAERQITNVAAGRISATSTDAVNGSQLNAVSTALAGVTATAGAGWNISAEGANASNVAAGQTVDLNNGDGNIDVTKTAGSDNVTFDLADNINVNSVTMGTTVLNASGLTIAGGPSITTTGIAMNGTTISGLAPGSTAAGSTQAINGGQLNAGLSSVATALGGGATYNPVTGAVTAPSYSVQGSTYNNVGSAVAGLDTAVTALASGTTGLVQQVGGAPGTGAITVGANTGGTTMNVAGTAGNRVVTGVAAGLLGATSTDAVNGSQLLALGNSAASAFGGTSSFNPATGQIVAGLTIGTTNYTNLQSALTALNATASAGWNLSTAQTGSGVAIGSSTFNVGSNGAVSLTAGNNITLTQNNGDVTVALNQNLTGISSLSVTGGPTINGSGITMNGTAISGLAPGSTAAGSTQAITGGQLNTGLASVAAALGGGTTYNPTTGALTAPSYTVQGSSYGSVGSAISGLDGAVTALANGTTGLVQQTGGMPGAGAITVGANTGGTTLNVAGTSGNRVVTGVAAGSLAATSSDAVNGSQLNRLAASTAAGFGGGTSFNPATGQIDVSLAIGGTNYTSMQAALSAVNATANAGWSVNTGATGSGVATGSGPAQVASGATATFTAGNNLIVNQSGTNVTYSVNPNLTGLTSIGIAGGPTIDANGISGINSITIPGGPTINSGGITMSPGDILNMGGNRITNVGPGINPTDAVNLSQLTSGLAGTLSQANSYTDTKFGELAFDLRTMGKDADGATASAMAMSQVPQAFEPGMGIIGAGVSMWQGEQAFAIGVSKASDNGRLIIKATGTYNTRKKGGAAVGVGIQF